MVLAGKLSRHVLSAVIFGSVAERVEKPFSDFDLCCIVKMEFKKTL